MSRILGSSAAGIGRKTRFDRRPWLDPAAVRRWHFYAGLFCLPFFCWLAVTGSVYLFRPDVEAWLDRPYENLRIDGPRALPSAEARAAMAAVPGSTFSRYEPPSTPTGAAQVVVLQGGLMERVYVHPGTLQAMKIVQDDHRPMELVAHLHGQLLLGERGSMLVETAGCWGVVMILTGLYLWLPRGKLRLGGVVYPRLGLRGRMLWRDLHAVSGLWISIVTLLLLLSGLPWSATWGNYLGWVRQHWAATQGMPDWPIGGADVGLSTPASPPGSSGGMPGMSSAEMSAMTGSSGSAQAGSAGADLRPLDRLVPLMQRLRLPPPIWISPPAPGVLDWTISSHVQDRPQRVTYTVDPDRAAVNARQGFGDLNIVDRVVNVAVATHEGQLFGRLNQAILLVNAAALLLLAASATVMWWRRRPAGFLGAPPPSAAGRFSIPLTVAIAALAVLLPLFGLSLVLVLAIERILLRRIPAARLWLGMTVQ